VQATPSQNKRSGRHPEANRSPNNVIVSVARSIFRFPARGCPALLSCRGRRLKTIRPCIKPFYPFVHITGYFTAKQANSGPIAAVMPIEPKSIHVGDDGSDKILAQKYRLVSSPAQICTIFTGTASARAT